MPNLLPTLPDIKNTNAEQTHWPKGNATAIAMSLAANLSAKQPALVVCANALEAQQFEAALSFFLSKKHRLCMFPDYETLPYDFFSPSDEIVSQRLKVLYKLSQNHTQICIVTINNLMQPLPPAKFVIGGSLSVAVGQPLNLEKMRKQLIESGYSYTDLVTEHGQFTIRGSLLDVFPMGQTKPLRIDLFDDEIETLRYFDPDTQLTIEKTQSLNILPGREFGLNKEDCHHFKNNWLSEFNSASADSPIYRAIDQGHSAQGIESYLPLFHDNMSSLFDYLADDCLLITSPTITEAAETHWHDIRQRFEQLDGNIQRPLLAPSKSFIPAAEVLRRCKGFARVVWGKDSKDLFRPIEQISFQSQQTDQAAKFKQLIAKHEKTLIVVSSNGRGEVLAELLERLKIPTKRKQSWQEVESSQGAVYIAVAHFEVGFQSLDNSFALVTEDQLLTDRTEPNKPTSRSNKQGWTDSEHIIRNLTELRLGAPIVHIEHGVGRYQGLITLKAQGQTNEFLQLDYSNDNKLYVPISSLNLISRYTGADSEHAPLSHLGTGQWDKVIRKAREQVWDTAAELLDIYAQRMSKQGFRFKNKEKDFNAFCSEFPFEETEDQKNTMIAVLDDMTSTRAMDRLVCGDVGFGKTEIAMRAAFLAAQNNTQVMLLVPTTLLARQHLENFIERFANWPINIQSVSRLKNAKAQTQTLAEFKNGKVDILIGTHKLLSDKLQAHNLGLLIIDEEHRFGVRQKDQLKNLKAEVDILALTATPIPRTLNMAMASIRDLSIITTPPAKRLAVKTFVREYDSGIITEALQRELLRGGQVYYLHNEVRTIERTAEELREQMPNCRIKVAHGQMPERKLERVINDFYHHHFDILVCSTIIETGIDIPNANTIIINRADKFGLAQLHQLRGRVGRSSNQAYAYLLTSLGRMMSKDASKRLEAIQEAHQLGSGFTLATHDLEIRGAGELLGDNQSGQIHAIGFELYQDMLKQAVVQLQSGEPHNKLKFKDQTDINLNASALIPDEYLPDVNSRLQLYKRISATKTKKQLNTIQVEMIDRFGLLPKQAKMLIRQQLIKQQAMVLGINKIDMGESGGRIRFNEKPNFEPMQLMTLIQTQPAVYQLDGQDKLRLNHHSENSEERFLFIEELLGKLSS